MFNYKPKSELEKFFKVYPDIDNNDTNININTNTNKYINLFKKDRYKSIIEDSIRSQSKQIRYSYNKTKTLLNLSSKKLISKSRKNSILNDAIKNQIINSDEDKELFNFKENDKKKGNQNSVKNNEKEEDYFLINKGILLQNNKEKRTDDVKKSLESFLKDSDFFEKLSNNLNTINSIIKNPNKFLVNRNDSINDGELQSKIKNKLNNIVLKLSEKVMIQKYKKDSFVIKMNEIGNDCYFLISGRVSILKPKEYKNIAISYRDYLIYLKCLLNHDEINLALKVMSENRKFLDIVKIDEITKLIRAYFIISLKRELNRKINGITIEEIEDFFKSYHFSFEDFQLNKNKILKDIENINNPNKNVEILLWNYFYHNISLSNEELFLLKLYNVSFREKNNIPLVTLYKYEKFLYLYPGSLFGDSALENKIKKRNASIRTEEDCIICSLSNEYYVSLLSEENKKLKTLDLIFLCHNFFFNLISPVIFNKYYYHMFKAVEKTKDDIIYKQNDNVTSVFLIREGMIKMELNASVLDLFNLIKNIIKEIYINNNNFKITLKKILEIKNNYLYDEQMNKIYNNDNLFLEANKKVNMELFISNGYECLGLQEFCLKMNYISTCKIITKKAFLMEIKKEDLNNMLKNEREILPNYYQFSFTKILLLIKRLHYLKKNILIKLANKFNGKSFNIFNINKESKKNSNININLKGNNNHKQKVEVLKSEKVKNIYKDIKNSLETNIVNKKSSSNSFSMTDRNFFSLKKKNFSSKNLISFSETSKSNKYYKLLNYKKYKLKNKRRKLTSTDLTIMQNDVLNITKKEKMNTTMSGSKKKNIKYREKIFPFHNEDKNDKNKIDIDIVNTKHGFISLKKIKKNILKSYKEKKDLTKLNIVRKYKCPNDEEKTFNEEFSFSNIKDQSNNISKFIKLNKFKQMKNQKNLIKNYKEKNNKLLLMSKDEQDNNSILYGGNGLNIEISSNRINKSALNLKTKESIISNNYKNSNENELLTKKRLNSSLTSLPGIEIKNKKINKLIGNMKRKYAISKGQKKFIYSRRSKKNKAIDLIDEKNHCNSYRQKSIGQSVKEYYFRKKVEGYSSLVNPLHNTFMNRQKTIKIIKKI